MGNKLFGFTVVIVILIIIACIAGYILAAPQANSVWGTQTAAAQQTEVAVQALTQGAISQEIDNLTAVAFDITQTEIARPTETPFPTPTIQLVECTAKTTVDTPVSLSPEGGWVTDKKIVRGDNIRVIAKLDDGDWYAVKYGAGLGWINSKNLEFDEACDIPNDGAAHLIALVNPRSVIKLDQDLMVEDTFLSNAALWSDDLGEQYEREFESSGFRLIIDALKSERKAISSKISNVSNPQIAFSVRRINADNNSYIGVLFESISIPGATLEIRIYGGGCAVKLYEDGILVTEQAVAGQNKCNGKTEDYIEIGIIKGQLNISINGSNPYQLFLAKDYAIGKLSLVANKTKASFGFIVVTTPK